MFYFVLFIIIIFVLISFFKSEDKVQGDKVVKESISISFINRLGIFIGVVGAIIKVIASILLVIIETSNGVVPSPYNDIANLFTFSTKLLTAI